jgi:hypothetical protein
MVDDVIDFYDELARSYHLIFENREASMTRKASAIRSILERESSPAESDIVFVHQTK